MIVKFKVNLGSVDAKPLDLDFAKCVVGAEVECGTKEGGWLVTRGIADDVTPAPKPEPLKAVPPAPEVIAEKPLEPQRPAKLKS